MTDWGKFGDRKEFDFPGKLRLKEDQQVRIRILYDEFPPQVPHHTHHSEEDAYLKFACLGGRSGCKFCECNSSEAYVKTENKDKPYPWHSQYAGPVWVYDTSELKLLIGFDVWMEDIKAIGKTVGTVTNCDMNYMRMGKGLQTAYRAVSMPPTPFAVTYDPAKAAALIEEYRAWLRNNVAKAEGPLNVSRPTISVPGMTMAPQPVQPVVTAGVVTIPAQPVTMAPAVVAGGTVVEDPRITADRKLAHDEFGQAMQAHFNPVLSAEVISQFSHGKPYDRMDPADIRAAAVEYTKRATQ